MDGYSGTCGVTCGVVSLQCRGDDSRVTARSSSTARIRWSPRSDSEAEDTDGVSLTLWGRFDHTVPRNSNPQKKSGVCEIGCLYVVLGALGVSPKNWSFLGLTLPGIRRPV